MHPDPDRESPIHRALIALPLPRAPHTLLPRIMVVIARPWYSRPWLGWPLAWQSVSLAAVVVAAAAAWLLLPDVEALAEAGRAASRVSTLADILSRLLLQPLSAWIFALSAVAAATCAAFWAALTRLAPGGPAS